MATAATSSGISKTNEIGQVPVIVLAFSSTDGEATMQQRSEKRAAAG